jgi:hypothetical protein
MPRSRRTSPARVLYGAVALLLAAAAIVTATVLTTSEGGRSLPGPPDASPGAHAPDHREGSADRAVVERTPTPPPGREYAPTEKVSPDKTVSFPTDI